MVEYTLARVEISTQHKTMDLNSLKSAIEYEYNDRNIDAHVRKVKKVRGPHEDVFIVYSDVAVTEHSPAIIDPWTAVAIVMICITLIAGAHYVNIWANMWQLGSRIPEVHPYEDLKEFILDILDGKSFRTIPSMTKYLEDNHPEWYPGKSFCDVCGMVFDSVERMKAHRIACPDIEPIGPGGIVPTPSQWTPGYMLQAIASFFRKLLRRET